MSMTMEEENIKVAVRIRPMQSQERKEGDIPCVKASDDGKEVQVKVGPLDASAYRCNQCFGNETTQSEFFNECGITELLDSSMKGYRSCAFAFGQTGAGKTFTMVGTPKSAGVSAHNREKQNGLISRSLEYLFLKLEAAGVKFSIKLSCMEIYHEQVFDLFADEKDRTPLAVREHAADGFFIEGCKLIDCTNYTIANGAFETASKNRQTGSHDLNSRSSRSHCLTEIHIEIPVTVDAEGGIDGGITHGEPGLDSGLTQGEYMSRGKISLVDLAGSERLKSTKSTGKVLQEAGFINKSLYVLGKVIAGLIRTNGDLNHKDVPYRDSKLTKLLISSLGGRSRTLLISCVSEAKSNQAETLRTLKFSMSCARIRNKPMKFLDPQEKLILDLKEEIKRLRNENKKLRSNLLTAPASGEKMRNSDDENSVMSRAYSAHSSLERERIKFKPRNGGKVYGTKMGSSQSDYLKKLSPIKKRNVGKAQRQMTKKEALHMLDNMRAGRAAAKSVAMNNNNNNNYNHSYAASAGVARGGLREDYDDDISSLGSAGNGNGYGNGSDNENKRQAELDDLVRRRGVGPMVFRGGSAKDLSPVRESTQGQSSHSPARSVVSADALRIAELEKRIARMETGVLAQPPVGYPHDHHADAHRELELYHTTAEAAGAAARPLEHMLGMDAVLAGQAARRARHDGTGSVSTGTAKGKKKKKEETTTAWKGKNASPYIAHLIEAAPKANQEKNPFGGMRSVLGEDHQAHMVSVVAVPRSSAAAAGEGLPPTRPLKQAGRSSADNLRSAVASGRSSSKVPSAPDAPSKGPAKDLHSSILDELAELGLGPLQAPTTGASTASTKKVGESKLTIKTGDRDGRSNSRSRGPVAKNPSLPSLSAPVLGGKKEKEVKKTVAPVPAKKMMLSPMREKAKSASGTRSAASAAAAAAMLTPSKIASDPGALKAKLETLEASLAEERERMEDNPGEVTAETEEQYEELTKQARMLRKRLEMSGLDLSFQKEELDDSAPTPEAVRLMAMQMESLSLNASRLPSKLPSTSDLMFAHSEINRMPSQQGLGTPTPLSKAASAKKVVEMEPEPPLAATENENDYEDDGYEDEDFEDDAKSKPGTAMKKAPSAPTAVFLTKDFSRKFEELELSVPDVGRFIKPLSVEEAEETNGGTTKKRRASISTHPQEQFIAGATDESMRQSAAAAVNAAMSFTGQADTFVSPKSTSSRTPAGFSAQSSEKPTHDANANVNVNVNVEVEADNYGEDSYEDEFPDEEPAEVTATATAAPAVTMERKEPTPTPAPAPAPSPALEPTPAPLSAFSPAPANQKSSVDYDIPILDSPLKPKYGSFKKKPDESATQAAAGSPMKSSAKQTIANPAPAPAPTATATAADEEEDEYDVDFDEIDAATATATAGAVGSAEPKFNQEDSRDSSAQNNGSHAREEYTYEAKSQPQPQPQSQYEYKSEPPASSTKASTAAAPVPASAKAASIKRAQTPGDPDDEYGADEFDDFED